MSIRRTLLLLPLLTFPATLFAASHGTDTAEGCRVLLSTKDARTLAENTPNARAFVQDFHATLSTTLRSESGGNAIVLVTANDPLHGEAAVGTYTVNLRSGHVTDDDMEPAEDSDTLALRSRLVARHCVSR